MATLTKCDRFFFSFDSLASWPEGIRKAGCRRQLTSESSANNQRRSENYEKAENSTLNCTCKNLKTTTNLSAIGQGKSCNLRYPLSLRCAGPGSEGRRWGREGRTNAIAGRVRVQQMRVHERAKLVEKAGETADQPGSPRTERTLARCRDPRRGGKRRADAANDSYVSNSSGP